jgi:hypothetical protein
MLFRPRDEISLRHLFSSEFCEERLRLSYIGPVLDASGRIQTSPDCEIWDMRQSPFRSRRCEFKHIPCGRTAFADNGQFEVAIMWALPPSLSKAQLQSDLLKQNGCGEVIVLNEDKAFAELPEYDRDFVSRMTDLGGFKEVVLDSKIQSVWPLYIAAKIFPDKFHLDDMIGLLCSKFPEVKEMQPRGRGNVVSAFLQTKPKLLEKRHGKFYRWAGEIDSQVAVTELSIMIRDRFQEHLPDDEDLRHVRK